MARMGAHFLAILAAAPALRAEVGLSQNISADAQTCKAVLDDKERLKCFDGVFSGPSAPVQAVEKKAPQQPPGEKQSIWSIDERQLPDGSQEIVALNFLGDDAVLILRCKEQTTEAAYSTAVNYLGYLKVNVEWRINDQSPIKEVWSASMNGRAAFAPDAVAFIQSLPDNAKLSIKTTRSADGRVKEGRFDLGAVSEVRSKVAKAFQWEEGSAGDSSGSINHHGSP